MDYVNYNITLGSILSSLKFDVIDIVIWIGLWGIFESVIDKYVGDNFNLRIIVYVCIFLIAVFLRFLTA